MTRINKDTKIGNSNTKLESLIPYVLYDNSSGTTSNIPLSDNINNYSYIEIYYRTNDGTKFQNCVKTKVESLIVASLVYNYYYLVMYTKIAIVQLTNSSLNFLSNTETYNGGNYSSGNFIYVTKVIGYK